MVGQVEKGSHMSLKRLPPMTKQELRQLLRRDVAANRGYPKSVLVLVLFRLAQYARTQRGPGARLAYLLVGAVYKFVSEWFLGIELPASTTVGAGLQLRHGVGTVVNPYAIIGHDVMLRQGITIGNRHRDTDCPRISDHVEIGAGACLIGEIRVGRDARIGAGAIVISDVPDGGLALGTPATIRPASAPADRVASSD